MIGALLLGASVVTASPDARAVSPSDLAAYESARSRVGRDSGAHVQLALWCESHGLTTERMKHLALAVLLDPKNATARGLMGMVAYRGKWRTPAEVAEAVSRDEALASRRAEYNARREELYRRFGNDARAAKAHVALGLWCEKNGLKPEAVAHFTTALTLDPYNDTPWKHLGCAKHHGRWVTREQVAAEQREAEARRKAVNYWEPLLKKWRAELTDPKLETAARANLAGVSDPAAVAAVVRVFRTARQNDQLRAVQLLGQIDAAESTKELAALAVFSPSAAVRDAAAETLRGREPRDFAGLLVELIHAPMVYEMQPVLGPGSPGVLKVETPRLHAVLVYDAPPAFHLSDLYNNYVGYDVNGRPVVATPQDLMRLQNEATALEVRDLKNIENRFRSMVDVANAKARDSQRRLAADVLAIERTNARTRTLNERVVRVLRETAGAPDLRPDEDSWRAWWNDRLGYTYEPPPQMTVELVASAQEPPSALPPLPPPHTSCFPAGTSVRTLEGDRPIETLRVGDRVLSQDVSTGALDFRPVLFVHHNGPGPILRFQFEDGETLLASIYHRIWRAGKGWAMARDLKPGDAVRTLDGLTRVVSVTPDAVAPLFNLDVDGSRTFFVGRRGVLVHDNRLPDPKVEPFDAAPTLATADTATAPRD